MKHTAIALTSAAAQRSATRSTASASSGKSISLAAVMRSGTVKRSRRSTSASGLRKEMS